MTKLEKKRQHEIKISNAVWHFRWIMQQDKKSIKKFMDLLQGRIK